jgi:hypothetical protein
VRTNTKAAIYPVAMVLIALFALSLRPPAQTLDVASLKLRLALIRYALGLASVILVVSVLVSKTLLGWPLTLIDESQAMALKPLADAMTLQLGAAGTIALIAAFAPAITAWVLDVVRFRGSLPKFRAEPKAKAGDGPPADELAFAPTSWVTTLMTVLAPIFAAPLVEALKSLLGVLPVK